MAASAVMFGLAAFAANHTGDLAEAPDVVIGGFSVGDVKLMCRQRNGWKVDFRREADASGVEYAVVEMTRDGGEEYPAAFNLSFNFAKRDTVAAWRYVLLEFDHMDEPGGGLPNQCAFWMGFLDDPAWRPCLFSLVYSGWKSIHGLLAVPRGADPERLYALLEARFCSNGHTSGTDGKGRPVYQYRADPAGFIMQSGTRLAGVRRLGSVANGRGRIQRLLYINPRLGYGWGQADRQADRNPPA